MQTSNRYDVAVIGCGPAGAVVSRELSRFGYRVLVVAGERRFGGIEGLSERAWNGLGHAGCRRALSVIGPEVRRVAHWNGEDFGGNHERVVDRKKLDAALLRDVGDAGARVIRARARSVKRDHTGWCIGFGSHADVPPAEAGYLIDARGRAARRRKSSWIFGPATMSLGRRYTPLRSDQAMTWLTTFESGWAWCAADGNGSAVVQLIRSIARDPLPPRKRIEPYFEALLAGVDGIGALVDIRKPAGAIHGRDGGTALCSESATRDHAKVGDAAFSIDPLSGHGMFEAISGALALAPVVNTLLREPGDDGIALGFYQEKLNADFKRMARTGRDFYRQEQRWPALPFWCERQSWPDEEPSHDTPGRARIECRAVSDEGLIRMRDVVVTGDHPRGIWRVAGVPLVDLLRYLRDRSGPTDRAFVNAAAQQFNTAPASVETATDWLRWRGLLEH